MNKKVFAIFIFCLGLAIFMYPMISQTYYDIYYRQEAKRIEDAFTSSNDMSNKLYEEEVKYNQSSFTDLSDIEDFDVGFVDDDESPSSKADFLDEDVIGLISIPSIDLIYPIYDGASDENLLRGVARIEGTSYPVGGINTNSVIAGHSGWVSKKYFSHLGDVVNGDNILIQNRRELITYEVYGTKIIDPTDVAALAIIPGQDTLTLLTCTTPPPGTQRYLVFAKRVENEEDSDEDDNLLEYIEDESVSSEDTSSIVDVVNSLDIDIFIDRYGVIIVYIILGLLAVYYFFIRNN